MKSLRGFTLAEMAVVVLIMGITLSMGLKMVTANLDNSAYSETKSKQERIKLALIGYLRTNGRLPCPNSMAPWDGGEDRPDNTPGTGASPATTCLGNSGRGVVPWQVLGLSREATLDGWGNFFTYRVANNTPGGATGSNWTIRGGTNAFDIGELTTSPITLTITERDESGAPGTPITNGIIVIVSHGKNGLGARTVKGTTNSAPTGGTDEATNATLNSTAFIRRAVSEVQAPTIGAYDDLVAYMTPQDLLQPLISEGTLKTCVAYCPFTFKPSCTSGTFSCTSESGIGVCAYSGREPTCTNGSPDCTSGGTPQCLAPTPPTTPCAATGIPIGKATATCP